LNLLIFFLFCVTGTAQNTVPQKQMPWSLRDHYTFGGTLLNLNYAKDNAEWRVTRYQVDSETSRINPDVLVSDVGFSIELGDGRLITHDMLGGGGETAFGRDPVNSESFGEGIIFSVKFLPYEGLYIEHKITRFKNWNFLLISISITNKSEKDITVRKIQSAHLAGSMTALSENKHISKRNYIFRGGHAVYTHDGGAATLFIHDPDRSSDLALGVLPSGIANSTLEIQPGSDRWQGRIVSSFAPGAIVAPGTSLTSDPIWFSMDAPSVGADAQFAWILHHYCRSTSIKDIPRSWVTIPDTEGITALRREAVKARSFGITHALIPGNWEGCPGSFEGGSPQYPRNIGAAARSLQSDGIVPGITIDPLLGASGSKNWLEKSVDGQNWVNINSKEGRKFAAKRIAKLVGDGFGFIVIEESQIPDEILQTFKITRAQADTLVFDIAGEAIKNSSVALFPAAKAHINLLRDEWLEAAGAVSRMAKFNTVTSPVRMRINENSSIDEETLLALSFWRGPIEFLGAPPRSLKSELTKLLEKKAVEAHPQDGHCKNPLTWLLRSSNPAVGSTGATILSFTGAEPWNIKDIEAFANENPPTLLWRLEENKPVLVEGGTIDTPEKFSTHGVFVDSEQPVFAGTDKQSPYGLNCLKKIGWDGSRGILSGQIDSVSAGSHLYFFVPSSLTLKSAHLNSKRVGTEINGQWISISPGSSGGFFELKFEAR
ncbi:MAG: hypothetical protein KAH38_00240, partial [Candidatus Hydrogenedentes bacterium]|nr:hypothetical protein [Candidatus Hydrogenedentota bacterium]